MSKFVFYLKTKPFLMQWLTYHYGNPVVFPARSAENACIRHFIGLNPKEYVPQKPGDDYVAVAIPEQKRKKAICWNYMSKSACEALMEIVEDTFKMQLWSDLNEMTRCGCTLLNSVRAWCENNGISTEYDYTLKMRYQRMRDSYLESGVDLRRQTKVIAKKNQRFFR
ncbi:MAG: hypothetical protein PUF37_05760 [Prevotellaceae bacterium]|nr:hypothetical protein [Prevotellaceae bacterium]